MKKAITFKEPVAKANFCGIEKIEGEAYMETRSKRTYGGEAPSPMEAD